jgi:hypothetical protein
MSVKKTGINMRKVIAAVKIHPKNTTAGRKQREQFKARWGISVSK